MNRVSKAQGRGRKGMRDERTQILSLDETVFDSSSDSISALLLVSVVTSSIEETVSYSNGVVDSTIKMMKV